MVEGDPDRFASLALLYAQIGNTDRIQGRLAEDDRGAVAANVVTESQFSSTPSRWSTSSPKRRRPPTPVRSRKRHRSLVSYIERNQVGRTSRQRIALCSKSSIRPVSGWLSTRLRRRFRCSSLLTMLFVTVGGIFVLDNWRRSPSVQSVEADVVSDDTGDTLRRIAPASGAASSAGPPTSQRRLPRQPPRALRSRRSLSAVASRRWRAVRVTSNRTTTIGRSNPVRASA